MVQQISWANSLYKMDSKSSQVYRRHTKKILLVALVVLAGAALSGYFGVHNHSFHGLSEDFTIGTGGTLVLSGGTFAYLLTQQVARRRFDRLFTDHSADKNLERGQSLHVKIRTFNGQKVVLKILPPRARINAMSRGENAFVQSGGADGVVMPTHYIVQRGTEALLVTSDEVEVRDIVHGSLSPYIEGSQDLNLYYRDGGQFSYKTALKIAQGLQKMHSNGFAHRDLKPANLLRDRHGAIHIIDLDEVCRTTNLETGRVGTDGYRAPEVEFPPDGGYDAAKADIFSLGRTLGENMLGLETLQPSFGVGGARIFNQREWTDATFTECKRTQQAGLAELVKQMTDLDPTKRPEIGEVVERLRSLGEG